MKVKELNENVDLLLSLDSCPVYGIRYAAKRTIDRILTTLNSIKKIEQENKSQRLIELEREKNSIQARHAGDQKAAERALMKWENFGEYMDEMESFVTSDDQKALMEQEEDVNIFFHKFKPEYLDEFSPNMKQMEALEIICTNFVDVADQIFSEKVE